MDRLTSSLQALGTGDANGEGAEPAKELDSALDPSTTPQPSLEKLPVELQVLVMSKAPTLQSLSALVHASPQLHHVYVEDRVPILRSVLAQVLNGMLVDALGVYHSGTNLFQATREKSLLWAFVHEHEAKYTKTATDWTAELSFDDIIHLLRFHTSVLEPLTERYASWALASLPCSSTEERAGQQPLSDTERCRIQRAIYRLQLFCNVCGYLGEGRSSPERIWDDVDRLRILLIFPAWEVEEILSIHEFAKDTYSDIFRRVAWDLNEERNPKYGHVSLASVNEDLLLVSDSGTEHEYMNPRSMNAVLEYGPQLLFDILKTEGHEQLVELVRVAIVSGIGDAWIENAIQELVQMERREKWYSQRDSAQDFRQKLPFDGDRLDSPTLAWVIYWRGEYSNLIGIYVPEALRRWGFVMWDAARLNSRAEARIDYWWWARWGKFDPRKDDYDSSVTVECWTDGS